MKTCLDCGVKIHSESMHTGREKWCEPCFEKGLSIDMHSHMVNYMAGEMDDEVRAENFILRGLVKVALDHMIEDDEELPEEYVHWRRIAKGILKL